MLGQAEGVNRYFGVGDNQWHFEGWSYRTAPHLWKSKPKKSMLRFTEIASSKSIPSALLLALHMNCLWTHLPFYELFSLLNDWADDLCERFLAYWEIFACTNSHAGCVRLVHGQPYMSSCDIFPSFKLLSKQSMVVWKSNQCHCESGYVWKMNTSI